MASVTCISYFSFDIPQSVLTTQLLNAVNQTQLLQAEKQRAALKPQNDAEFRRSVNVPLQNHPGSYLLWSLLFEKNAKLPFLIGTGTNFHRN